MGKNALSKWIKIDDHRWMRPSDGFILSPIRGGGKAVTQQNDRYAFGDDDGSESGHTLDTENTDRATQPADVTFMLRIQIEETGGGDEVQGYAIFGAKNSGAFTEITTARADGIKIANDTQSRADDEATTERLTAGAGTFAAGKYDDGQTQQGTTSQTINTNYIDLEFALQIDSATATDTDFWEFKVTNSAGVDLDSYPGTYPTATYEEAQAPIDLVPQPLSQANLIEHTGALVQVHNLQKEDLSQANLIEHVGALVQIHNLQVDDLSQSNSIEFITGITQQSELTVHDLDQSNSVTVPPIFTIPWFDGFESGDAKAWLGTSGTLDINGTAAIDGSYGLEIDYLNTEYAYLQWVNSTQQVYRVKFKINENTLVGTGGTNITIVTLMDGATSIAQAQLVYSATDTSWSIKTYMRNDAGGWDGGEHNPFSGEVEVEVEWEFKETTGYSNIWIDGLPVNGVSASDSDTRYPDEARFGHVTSTPDPTSGTVYVDSFNLYDTLKPIVYARDLAQSNLIEHITVSVVSDLVVADLSQTNTVTSSYTSKVSNIHRATQKAYWPLTETEGTDAFDLSPEGNDGTYVGVDLADTPGPDGVPVPFFDGSNDYVNVYTANLLASFPHDEGTFFGWAKPYDVGVWTDATTRSFGLFARDVGGANFMLNTTKKANNNQLNYFRDDGNDNEVNENILDQSWTAWTPFALTWSVKSGSLKFYLAGSQAGSTQPGVLTAADFVTANYMLLGAGSQAPSNPWHGWMAHLGVYAEALPADLIAELADPTAKNLRLEQAHNLQVDDLSQANLVEHISTTKESTLTVDLLSQSNDIEFTSLTQVHNVTVYDLSQANLIEHIDLSSEAVIGAQNLSQSNLVLPVVLTQIHNITVYDLSQANLIEHVTVNTASSLEVDDLSQTNSIETVSLTQLHILSVDDLSQANLIEKVDLTVESTLIVEDLSQANLVEKVTLAVTSDLIVHDLAQQNFVSKLDLTQIHILSVYEISQSNLVTHIVLSTAGTVVPFALSQSNEIEAISLTQVHNLSIKDLSQYNHATVSFLIDFETGDLSQFNTVIDPLGDLTVSGTAAMVGSYGLEIDTNGQPSPYGILSFSSVSKSHIEFWIDPNSLSMLNGNQFAIFNGFSSDENPNWVIYLYYENDVHKIWMAGIEDDISYKFVTRIEIPDTPTKIRAEWKASSGIGANNGYVKLWINASYSEHVNLDNDERDMYKMHLGAPWGLDVDTSGTFYLDDLRTTFQLEQEPSLQAADISQANSIEPTAISVEHNLLVDDLGQLNTVTITDITHQLFVDDISQANLIGEAVLVKNLALSNLFQANVVEYVVWGASLDIKNLYQTNTVWNSSFWQEQFEFTVTIAQYLYVEVGIDTQTNIIPVEIEMSTEVSEVDL